MRQSDLDIRQLRPATFDSPLRYAGADRTSPIRYRTDDDRVVVKASFTRRSQTPSDETLCGVAMGPGLSFERAGPRARLAYDPSKVTAAIITCGGLCPGLNDVVRALTLSLHHGYGVRNILGIRYGFIGLTAQGRPPLALNPDLVEEIHRQGGTMLGSSRGFPPMDAVMEGIRRHGIDQLFVIGGDGTQRGAHNIHLELQKQGLPVVVVGVPKTIDNDIPWIDQTFGFETAVEVAAQVVDCAHVEAKASERGIGLVKLMGRNAGFIAAHAALSSMDANLVLVPEVPFVLDGPNGLLAWLTERMDRRNHAVIVVAEGAGQDLLAKDLPARFDASGNRLLEDIGPYLKERIDAHFKGLKKPVSIKYLDPSYQVRSAAANSADSIFCLRLAQNAVHAAMAGKTDMLIGRWYGKFTHVPLPLIAADRKNMDPRSSVWRSVLETTGQPCLTPA